MLYDLDACLFSRNGCHCQHGRLQVCGVSSFRLRGTLAAGWFSDRYLQGRRGPVIAVLMIGLAGALLALGKITAISAVLGAERSAVALGLVAVTGFLLFGPYSLV